MVGVLFSMLPRGYLRLDKKFAPLVLLRAEFVEHNVTDEFVITIQGAGVEQSVSGSYRLVEDFETRLLVLDAIGANFLHDKLRMNMVVVIS